MKIGIIGLGLIGGSLGLDLRSLGHFVWGMSRKEATCESALEMGAIDKWFSDFIHLPQDNDVIFLCTPIGGIIPTLQDLVTTDRLLPQTIVTDVGSVKTAIVTEGEKLWSNFVGSHPMAGNAQSGIQAAQAHLFNARPCAVIGQPSSPQASLVAQLWRSVGMEVYFCDTVAHDRAVAWISHLPVVVSAALSLACDREDSSAIKQLSRALASSGFADTSRVGAGNPELGKWMAQANKQSLLTAIDNYETSLAQLKQTIESEAWDDLEYHLTTAHNLRPHYLRE